MLYKIRMIDGRLYDIRAQSPSEAIREAECRACREFDDCDDPTVSEYDAITVKSVNGIIIA